jgi:ubiquinone/menaquinone biosynthesis C-methylase UbiE
MLYPFRSIVSSLAVALAITAYVAAQTQAPDRPRSQPGTDVPAEINKAFQDPDVAAFIKRFESESREVYNHREEIVNALGLTPRMEVADIGAGTGLFTRIIADRLGPKGKVFAVDISPAFLKHIADEAKKRGKTNVQTVQGTQETTKLPPHSIDVAFLCDVYHHLEKPKRSLASIHAALRPGGRLVVIEFDRREGVSSDFILKHVRADKAKFLAEIAAAGFEPIRSPEAPKLKENFFAEFRRIDRKVKTP